MSLGYYFRKAGRTIDGLTPSDFADLSRRCREIHAAEENLLEAGRSAFGRCENRCEGLCCRNVALDEIIGFADFVYILTIAEHLRESITICLERENRLFAADCIFLLNGKGPCLFPSSVRPEVCITTFCTNIVSVNAEIGRIKFLFMKLNLFISFLQIKKLINHIFSK